MNVLAVFETQAGSSPFDSIKQVDAQGNETWSARDMATPKCLDYVQWRTMKQAVKRAKHACKNSGHNPDDHFAAVGKMVDLGSGSQREIEDFKLSRYACYLVVMNGDPIKPQVAAGQTYFVMRTREAELAGERFAITEAMRKIKELKAGFDAMRDELAVMRKGVFLSPHFEAPPGWNPVIPWAKDRGIEFKTLGEKSTVGNQVSDIAKRMGYTPCKARYKGKGRERTHYPPDALEKWLAIYLRDNPAHRYPSLFSVETEPSPRRAKKPG